MLCESKQIYKNPKYRVIRYNNQYFMVDLVSTWITYFFPMINWFLPKKYAKTNNNPCLKVGINTTLFLLTTLVLKIFNVNFLFR